MKQKSNGLDEFFLWSSKDIGMLGKPGFARKRAGEKRRWQVDERERDGEGAMKLEDFGSGVNERLT